MQRERRLLLAAEGPTEMLSGTGTGSQLGVGFVGTSGCWLGCLVTLVLALWCRKPGARPPKHGPVRFSAMASRGRCARPCRPGTSCRASPPPRTENTPGQEAASQVECCRQHCLETGAVGLRGAGPVC